MDEPTLELQTLPSTLKYTFLDEEKAKPVIISSRLDTKQEEQLLEVLRKNKEAIGWTLTILKGLDPSLCTHRIFLEDESRPVREAQRRLNPRVWEALKEEILKWLNAEIIYPISDRQWVSPDALTDEVEGLHRLSEAELRDQEGSLPATVHRPDPGPTGRIELLLLSRRIFGLQSYCYPPRRSREDNVHLSFWHLRLQTHAILTVQCPRDLLTIHDSNFF